MKNLVILNDNTGKSVSYECRIVRKFYKTVNYELVFPGETLRAAGLAGAIIESIPLPPTFSTVKSRQQYCVIEIIEGPQKGERFTVPEREIQKVE